VASATAFSAACGRAPRCVGLLARFAQALAVLLEQLLGFLALALGGLDALSITFGPPVERLLMRGKATL